MRQPLKPTNKEGPQRQEAAAIAALAGPGLFGNSPKAQIAGGSMLLLAEAMPGKCVNTLCVAALGSLLFALLDFVFRCRWQIIILHIFIQLPHRGAKVILK